MTTRKAVLLFLHCLINRNLAFNPTSLYRTQSLSSVKVPSRHGSRLAPLQLSPPVFSGKEGFVSSIKSYFSSPDDGLTFRQRLGKLGLATVLSYGWVSNMSYCVSVSLAWFIFSKNTGLSPLAPGQWKRFLGVYAGFFVFNNIIRPLRLAVAVGVGPKFDSIVLAFQDKFKLNKAAAIGLTVFLTNIVGTLSFMCLGIFLASLAAGVPVWAK